MRHLLPVLALLVLVLPACASSAADEGPVHADGWSYTTGFGNTIELDAEPEVIVADTYSAAALWEYGIRPDAVFGFGLEPGGSPLALGNADVESMENVSPGGEINLEALAKLEPDLVIGYGNQEKPDSWTWWEDNTAEHVNAIAPFVGIKFSAQPIVDVIEEYAGLAEALGADVERSSAVQAKAEFEKASAQLEETVATKPDLTTIALNGDTSQLYVGTTALAQLDLLEQLGITLVGPESDGPWAEVSWERVPDWPADVVLEYVNSAEPFADAPIYQSLPAVKADQIAVWDDKSPNTYVHYAAWLTDLNRVYEAAEDVTD